MSRWLLDGLEIEGFRGINNEGDPLVLRFGGDAINSVSAPNGSGKSSIFDAVAYAIRGSIRKLDELPAAKRGADYYLNRFHAGGIGTVVLILSPEAGGASVRITVTRAANGTRTVTGPVGVDAERLLASLNEDFVLLDHNTFQAFIDDRALDRGRAFSGLLGLARYSKLRQGLQGLANTRAYSNHVQATALAQRRTAATTLIARHERTAASAFFDLTQQALAEQPDIPTATARAHDALSQINILTPHCDGKPFGDIAIDECLASVRLAEGGAERERLSILIREQPAWERYIPDTPTEGDRTTLLALAAERDAAIAETSGTLFRELYLRGKQVLESADWTDKTLCPLCGQQGDHSLLDEVHEKLTHYQTVEVVTDKIASTWSIKNWSILTELEGAVAIEGDEARFDQAQRQLANKGITATEVTTLWDWRQIWELSG